ncbi:MAG: rhodanese-like domain-containing protein [Magnetococcales bacterium]|nr:rhodanese-like domain-containing protein [Magnetococcales bacterium]
MHPSRVWKFSFVLLLVSWLIPIESSLAQPVNITKDLEKFTVKHGNQQVTVMRNQDTRAVIEPDFAKVARNCPPFCIQPMEAAPGVKTIEELELIDFMMREVNNETGLLIDARTPDWNAQGVIPGSINIPYSDISPSMGANPMEVERVLKPIGVITKDSGQLDFAKVKKVAIWCNGPWCGQSHAAIRGLIELGFPAEKILYYRGGMQMWKLFGFTVVPPVDEL